MKRKVFLVVGLMLLIASVVGAVVSANGPRSATVNASQLAEAAFRDGQFQARLDVQNGRGPHVASGRWSTASDRALFVAGYQQGYREYSEAHAGN
jgi:hypothetical protein